jgi:hypothetical protein
VVVFPRQPQERFDPGAEGFNAAVCEVSGLVVAFSPEAFVSLVEKRVQTALTARVGLAADDLASLCRVIKE